MGFCSGLSAGYLDLSPTSGNAWSPFFFFNMGADGKKEDQLSWQLNFIIF